MNLLGDPSDADLDFHSTVHLNGVLPMVFGAENWGPDAPEGRVRSIWSGSLGITADAMPFVGRLEESLTGRKVPASMRSATNSASTPPGEFIAAGYCGEGMVSAWLCGVALALMVLGREDKGITDPEPGFGFVEGPVQSWFPEEYIVSAKRVRDSNVVKLLEWL
jgi:glycine/D-amino acid oxidase-like deaminating enzyme